MRRTITPGGAVYNQFGTHTLALALTEVVDRISSPLCDGGVRTHAYVTDVNGKLNPV